MLEIFFKKNKILQLSNSSFLMKLKLPSSVTPTQTGAWPPSATNIVNRILGMHISIKNDSK